MHRPHSLVGIGNAFTQRFDQAAELLGQRVANGIRHVDRRRARLDHLLDNAAQKINIRAASVFRRKLNVVGVVSCPRHRAHRLIDYLPDTNHSTPDEQTFEKALTEAIEDSLGSLKDRESKILRLYFGIDGAEPMTLEEIGSLFGITRERVRQIKEKALSRLRHVSRSKSLESFLG